MLSIIIIVLLWLVFIRLGALLVMSTINCAKRKRDKWMVNRGKFINGPVTVTKNYKERKRA